MRLMTTVVAALLVSGLSSSAFGQGSARSLDLDPSIRAAGMGGASTAVFWGGDPNYWANPAVLGYHHGLRFDWGETQLVPDLTDQVFFRSKRFSLGYGGIGVASAGRLENTGHLRLDYGRSEGTDEQGNPTGVFEAFEDIKSLGLGVSLSNVAITQFRAAGKKPPQLFRLADVAIGYNEKSVRVRFAPGFDDRTVAKDHGILARISMPVPFDDDGDHPRGQLDVAYGYSVLNYNDDAVVFNFPTSRIYRTGVAARAAVSAPDAMRNVLGASSLDWIGSGFEPFLSLGFAFDQERFQAGNNPFFGRYQVDRWGGELSLANMMWLRGGHVRDLIGDIDDYTWGVGAGLDLGFVGARYDHAEIPQARGLARVKRDGFTVYVDPFGIARLLSDNDRREGDDDDEDRSWRRKKGEDDDRSWRRTRARDRGHKRHPRW